MDFISDISPDELDKAVDAAHAKQDARDVEFFGVGYDVKSRIVTGVIKEGEPRFFKEFQRIVKDFARLFILHPVLQQTTLRYDATLSDKQDIKVLLAVFGLAQGKF